MTIINKYTGRDVSSEFLALMEGTITNKEFELITMTLNSVSYTHLTLPTNREV